MARRREIRGSVVVITGASSGVGRATAIAFSTHETKIVLAARAAEPLRAVAADCEHRGAETLVVPTDIADAGAVEHLARQAVERFGRIDIWVEAAGVLIAAPFGAETPEEVHASSPRTSSAPTSGHELRSRCSRTRVPASSSTWDRC